jgi:hypothetical protein
LPLARHARQLATSPATSSGCTAAVHFQPSKSSSRSPTNSSQRWLKKSRYPSGRPVWISAGRESIICEACFARVRGLPAED